ncbi:MAG: AAA family ATPase [Candidatus Rokubacteria bacterium]|nr:AAA family ATPase [Candidatus Rokubacteria bacterium]
MITRLAVKNFKSLRDISVHLGPRTVLVGPNMAGKSNFLGVFRFLRRMVQSAPGTLGLPSAVVAEGGFGQLAWRGGDSNVIQISIDGEFLDKSAAGDFRSWAYSIEVLGDRQRGSLRVQDETLTATGSDSRAPLIRKDAGSGRRVILQPGKGAVTEIDSSDRSALEFELPDWLGNQVRQIFASTLFYKLIPQLMRQPNPVAAPYHLDEAGTNLSAWLMMLQTRHQPAFSRLAAAVAELLPDVASVFTWPTQQGTVYLAAHERALSSPIGVSEMSDGELCLIALLSVAFAPPEYGAPLICLEEPENYLHPRLIHALADLIAQRQQELGAESAQLAITTHSPYLLDKLGLDDILYTEKRNGATHLTRPRDKPHLQELITNEEIGLGDLFYSGALGRD